MSPEETQQKTAKDQEIDAIFAQLVEDVLKDEAVDQTTYQYTSKETKQSSMGGTIPMVAYSVSSVQKDLAQDTFIQNLKLKGLWQ